jgi:hypothetical protein
MFSMTHRCQSWELFHGSHKHCQQFSSHTTGLAELGNRLLLSTKFRNSLTTYTLSQPQVFTKLYKFNLKLLKWKQLWHYSEIEELIFKRTNNLLLLCVISIERRNLGVGSNLFPCHTWCLLWRCPWLKMGVSIQLLLIVSIVLGHASHFFCLCCEAEIIYLRLRLLFSWRFGSGSS